MFTKRFREKNTKDIKDTKETKDTALYAHRGKKGDYMNFLCWMYNVKEPTNEEEQRNFEAYYFGMCLILPYDLFMVKVCELGGLKEVLCNNIKIEMLSEFFKAPESLVKVRINDLIKRQEEKEKEQAKKELEEKTEEDKNKKTPKKVKIKLKRSITKK